MPRVDRQGRIRGDREALLEGKELLSLEVDERARLGLLQSFQHPTEVPGVALREFLLEAAEERGSPGRRPWTGSNGAARFDVTRFLDRSINDLRRWR